MDKIKLNSKVVVSDPCYTIGTWCQHKLTDVLPGEYHVDVQKSDEGGWGNRVSSLTVTHKDYVGKQLRYQEHGDIGVDSGQAGIFCESSYRNDDIEIDTPEHDFTLPFSDDSGDRWYEKMCKFTLSGLGWGSYETGVVTSSGYGDGGYPLEIIEEDGKIVGMRITYIFPDDEEEEYEEDEEYGGEG